MSLRSILFFFVTVSLARTPLEQPQFDYTQAHQHALVFYLGQQLGKLPDWNTLNWRSDSALNDGKDVGLDLSRNYADCGDHVMFGMPGSFALYSLALSGIHYRAEYKRIGEWDRFIEILKWGTDFWIRAHPEKDVLYGQVGNGELDHSWWGPPEFMQMERPSYKLTPEKPGSDLASSVSATLALSSVLFRGINQTYADILLSHARDLFDFADQYRGFYHNSITDARSFYTSSHYDDELILGSLAMYWATKETRYSDYAFQNSRVLVKKTLTWSHVWDDASYASVFLLWKLLGDVEAEQCLLKHFEHWLNNVPRTPGGLAWLTGWGSLRYPTATSFLMLMYLDSHMNPPADLIRRYEQFALSQVNYVLGNNPYETSYLNGFGAKYFEHAHHRGAHGSWNNSMFHPPKNRNRNYALIGGPAQDDSFSNDIVNFGQTECCMDMQVGFVGTTIALSKRYPGTPLRNFPPKEIPEQEYFIGGSIARQSKDSIQVNLQIEARTGWPPRSENLCFRYYLYLEQQNIEVHSYYNEQAEIGILTPDLNNECTYFIPVCWVKGKIYPQSTTTSRKQAQLTIHLPYNNPGSTFFDRSKDYSYQELSNVFRDNLQQLPIYENGRLVVGSEPRGVVCISAPSPTANPTPSPTANPTPSPTANPTPSPTACSPLWGQCGGKTWSGPTCCVSGSSCKIQNDYYSQCLPGPTPPPNPGPTPAPNPGPTPAPNPGPTPAPNPGPTPPPNPGPTPAPGRRTINCMACSVFCGTK